LLRLKSTAVTLTKGQVPLSSLARRCPFVAQTYRFIMPQLSKSKGNLKTCRLSIPDELIAWCGWAADEFVSIQCHNEPDPATESMKRYLIVEAVEQNTGALAAIRAKAVRAVVKKPKAEKPDDAKETGPKA